MTGWVAPALGFVVMTGALGVTTKLALRDVGWPELILWTAMAYATVAVCLLLTGTARFEWAAGAPWTLVSGTLPVLSLILMFMAIGATDVSRVVPVTATYPLVTALLAALVLAEALTPLRLGGIALITLGVIMVSR